MFGKFFSSTFTGSMFGAGCDVFAVWGFVIANAIDSHVELNPLMLAATLGTTPDKVIAAIATLCDPDPRSRNPEEDGKRLLHEGGFQYRVVSHSIYRKIRNEEERREYNRQKQRESRDRRKSNEMSLTVNDGQSQSTMSAHTEAETDTETKKKPSRAKRTSDPRTSEFRSALLSYWSSKNPNVDMPWDGSEAKQLSSLLAANPTLTEMAFKQLLRHRYASRGVNHAERPRSWLSRATDYAAGPLNQFKQPEGTINGRPSANLQRKQSSDEAIERAARELDDADETGAGLLPQSRNPSRYRQSLPQSVGGDY